MINGPTLLCTHILPTKKEILLQTSNSQWYYVTITTTQRKIAYDAIWLLFINTVYMVHVG